MTDDQIKLRLARVYAAMGDTQVRPEDVPVKVAGVGASLSISQDFSGGRSAAQDEKDLAPIINEIMGIRDRATRWLKNKGTDPSVVDQFVKTEQAVSLIHDLANADKHGGSGRNTFSGVQPQLKDVRRGMYLTYDPVTGKFATTGQFIGPVVDVITGAVSGEARSSNVEIGLTGWVIDENGNEICQVPKLIPDAIYKWEQFLQSHGLVI